MAGIGTTLRDARLSRGLSIERVAQETRISARFIDALETEQFHLLPAPVYVRGFLRSYANYLRIDPAPLLARLDTGGGRPLVGPDAFVGGPPSPASRDPFQRGEPGRPGPFARTPPPPPPRPPPPPPRATFDEADAWGAAAPGFEDGAEEEYARPAVGPAPSRMAGARTEARAGGSPAGGEFRPAILVERPVPTSTPRSVRLLALAGIAVFALIVVAALAILLFGGGGGGNGIAAGASETPTRGRGTEVSLRSPSPTAGVRASPSPSPSASATVTAAGSPSPTPTTGTETPTATPVPATPTATIAPPTPTPTQPAATVTEAAPTPTQPPPPLPSTFGECPQGNCGDSPYRIVCGANGFFVDNPAINGTFPLSEGLYERFVPRLSNLAEACR